MNKEVENYLQQIGPFNNDTTLLVKSEKRKTSSMRYVMNEYD
jgi:hypothetical protein